MTLQVWVVLMETVIIYCLILTLLYFTPGENGVDGKDGAPGEDGADGKDGAPGQPGHTTVISILYTVQCVETIRRSLTYILRLEFVVVTCTPVTLSYC
jgi:hypothetical protein